MKDLHLPKMYSIMRDTLLQAGWTVVHGDPADTFVVLGNDYSRVRCILHYMPAASKVYPNGSWCLKIAADEDTWVCNTATYPIDTGTATLFTDKFKIIKQIHDLLKHDMNKDPF